MLSVKNEVTLPYRQASFSRLNSINEKIMAEVIAQKKIRVLTPSKNVGATDYPLLVEVSSGSHPGSSRLFVCNDLRRGYWRVLSKG